MFVIFPSGWHMELTFCLRYSRRSEEPSEQLIPLCHRGGLARSKSSKNYPPSFWAVKFQQRFFFACDTNKAINAQRNIEQQFLYTLIAHLGGRSIGTQYHLCFGNWSRWLTNSDNLELKNQKISLQEIQSIKVTRKAFFSGVRFSGF